MILLLVILAIAGLLLASEYLMSRNSKWDLLAQKYGNTSAPSKSWQGCKFLRMEIQEGNRLKVTTYGHGPKRDAMDFLSAKLFPKALVSTSPAGLYLKRQPWNFLHKPILIPWSRINSSRTLSASDFATQAVSRQIPIPGFQPKIPGVLAGVVNALTGEIVEVQLHDPHIRIQLPAAAVGDVTPYLKPKPSAPTKQPSLVGAV